MKTVSTKDMTKAQWLEARMKGIGGSDAGAVVGVNPYKSRVDVWLEKTGKKASFNGNAATHWGELLEGLVAKEYADNKGVYVAKYNYMIIDGCRVGNVDRLVSPQGKKPSHLDKINTTLMLECKTAGDEWPDGLPAHYEAQVQHYMSLTPEINQCDVAVLFMRSRKFQIIPVVRDDEVISALTQAEDEFWRKYVVGGAMPDPVSESDCKALWSTSRGIEVPATPESVEALTELAKMAAAAKEAEAREAELRMIIMSTLGEGDTLVDSSGKILCTWKSRKDSTKTDWKAVAADVGATPEQIAAHTVVSQGVRTFLNKIKA